MVARTEAANTVAAAMVAARAETAAPAVAALVETAMVAGNREAEVWATGPTAEGVMAAVEMAEVVGRRARR